MARILRVVGAIGAITSLFSLAFLVPLLVSLVYDEYDTTLGTVHLPSAAYIFAGCALGSALLGAGMQRLGRRDAADLRDRDAILTVGLGWLWLCLVGMMPFILSGLLPHPLDAFFETMSAMTTTGATVIPGSLDDVVPSVMMWRAFLQFIGGMGIVVLSVAVLARLTQGGLQMLQAEAPGPSVTRIAPRLAQTARILWGVYLGMSGVLFLLLTGALARHGFGLKQTLYEALLHTFTTISTGGFSNHDASIAFFDDWLIEAILVVFMLVSATNYTLHYYLLVERRKDLLRDPEWRFFMATFVATVLIIGGALVWAGDGVTGAFRGAVFTVASLISSTGFATVDFDGWPAIAKLALLFLMVTGGTAGSTAGGLKHVRALLLLKMLRAQYRRIRHPNAVLPVRLGNRTIQPATLLATSGFFLAFVAVWGIGTMLLLAGDAAHFSDPVDAASASISALSNMGPGLGVVGPSHTYADLGRISEATLAFEMWFGRLEVFTALLVFMPETWRH